MKQQTLAMAQSLCVKNSGLISIALARIFQPTPVKARTALPFGCPFIELSRLDERAGNAETKLYRTGRA